MGLFGSGPQKVLERGAAAAGRLVAVRVSSSSSGESTIRVDEYVVEAGGRRYGVRQVLSPDGRVRLGMPVHVKIRGDDLFIDWSSTMASLGSSGENETHGWKSIKDWGGEGITDTFVRYDKAAKKGSSAVARLDAVEHVSQLGGMMRTITFLMTVTIDGDEPYSVELKRQAVPHYATHLATVGATLPAFVDDKRLDKVTIDWPTAAELDPGVGRPPSPDLAFVDVEPTEVVSGGAMVDGGWVPADAPADLVAPPDIEGVSWSTYLTVTAALRREGIKPKEWDAYAQRFGVPAGAWATASHGWGKAMMRDSSLQLAYAAAMR